MATDSFKFWDSYMHALDRVDDATAGWLIKALAHKVFEDVDPEMPDPVLGMVFDVMLGQASRSAEMAALGRKGGQSNGRSRASKAAGSAASKRERSGPRNASNEKKREEAKGTEASSLSDRGYGAGGGLTPPPADGAPPLP